MPICHSTNKTRRITAKEIDGVRYEFHLSILEHQVIIHKVMNEQVDVFERMDQEILKDAHDEFVHKYINVAV